MKFHYSELKERIKYTIEDILKIFSIFLYLLVFFLVIVIFCCAKLLSFGFMKKISNYFIELQSNILKHLLCKMFFTLYCG